MPELSGLCPVCGGDSINADENSMWCEACGTTWGNTLDENYVDHGGEA